MGVFLFKVIDDHYAKKNPSMGLLEGFKWHCGG